MYSIFIFMKIYFQQMVLIKKSLSHSSMEENLDFDISLLFLLLCKRLQEERVGGDKSKEIAPLLAGIFTGAVLILQLSNSSTALFTAMALQAKSSKSFMLLCLFRLVGV